MKTQIIVLLCISSLACFSTVADVIYDIDYNPPVYTNGQQLNGRSTEVISDSIDGFSSQGMLMRSVGSMSYHSGELYTSGVYLVTWDVAIPSNTTSSSGLIHCQLTSDSGTSAFYCYISGNSNAITLFYGERYPEQPQLSLNIGQSYSFKVLLNLDSYTYNFWLDDVLLEDNVDIYSTCSGLEYVAFSQDQVVGALAGVDNFVWQSIPEPASLMMVLGGAAALTLARRRRFGRK